MLWITLALIAAAGYILVRGFYLTGYYPAMHRSIRMVIIIVRDQEPWVEGFLRRLFFRLRATPWVSVQVVDDGSCDRTRDILRCLQMYYAFEYFPASNGININDLAGNKSAHIWQFDVRGVTGKDLLQAPVFSFLSVTGAGKSGVMSK